jgi:23S rRNA pseudouridine1911/1915/1917 synthase
MPKAEEELAAATALVVADAEAGVRLDGFLVRRGVLPSASAARRALASSVVRVNGRPARKGVHLAPGDRVDLAGRTGLAAEAVLVPTPAVELAVLYADEHLVAVAKPAGLPCHPLRPGEGASLASALVARFPECAQASPDAREGGLGHRLDVATSGVLLAARSRETWHRLREALAAPLCEKIYLAEVIGRFPARRTDDYVLPGARPSSFLVTAPIGRQGRTSGRVRIAAGRQPLPARTEVALLDQHDEHALVEARLARGRAHQVRAHLAYLGIPVRGDALYGRVEPDIDLRLHAGAVGLAHPITGQPLRITAPPPAWVRAYSNWAMLVSTSR